jgi:hypothetical protein
MRNFVDIRHPAPVHTASWNADRPAWHSCKNHWISLDACGFTRFEKFLQLIPDYSQNAIPEKARTMAGQMFPNHCFRGDDSSML